MDCNPLHCFPPSFPTAPATVQPDSSRLQTDYPFSPLLISKYGLMDLSPFWSRWCWSVCHMLQMPHIQFPVLIPCPLPTVIPKIRYLQYHNWRRHISHSYLNYQVSKVSSEELLLSRLIRRELSRLRCHDHSLLFSSYLHRISRKKNSACSACGHPLQDLNHLLLDCPASEPLCKSIFGSSLSILDLWSRPWGVARLLGLRGVPLRPHPSEGVG